MSLSLSLSSARCRKAQRLQDNVPKSACSVGVFVASHESGGILHTAVAVFDGSPDVFHWGNPLSFTGAHVEDQLVRLC